MAEYKIPFNGRSHNYAEEEIELVAKIMQEADTFTQGKYLKEFEDKLRQYLNHPNVFAVSNATNALEMIAQLCQFKEGDEVIAPSHTYTASVYPFIKHGAKVVWADIDLETRVITLDEIKRKVTKNTKAIMIPHLYGYMAQMDEIMEWVSFKGLIVIEDCAQSFGAFLDGKASGTYGHFAAYSFHSQKNITTLGEGGAIAVKDKKIAKLIPQLRHNGHCAFENQKKYWLPAMINVDIPVLDGLKMMPNNFCMDEVKCALGSRLIDRMDAINLKRSYRAFKFINALSQFNDKLVFHKCWTGRHCYHLLAAMVKSTKENRDWIIDQLAIKHGIQCAIQYMPLNRYGFYRALGYGEADCPNANCFYDHMISFPFYSTLFDEDIEYMINALKEMRY